MKKERTFLLQNELTAYCLWATSILRKTFYLKHYQQVPSTYNSEPASDNDWERLFTYDRTRNGQKIEPFGMSYFKVSASEKTSMQSKNISV